MKAKVIALNERAGKPTKTTVNNQPVKVGDTVDVDANTFRNLAKKGILEAADAESKAVSLDTPSRLSEAGAEASIERIETERETKRLQEEEAAKAAKKK